MDMDAKDQYVEQLEMTIVTLESRIEELERMLGINSQNSSQPPSSDGPGVDKPRRRGKDRKKRGARKGHAPHMRKLFEAKDVTQFISHEPHACTCGCQNLQACDEEPLRHQTVDLPEIKPVVVEHVQHVRQCQDCGALVYAPLPDEVKRRVFGPGVLAIVGILTGMLNTSKRKALAVVNEVFHVPMSLGGLSNCEAKIAEALEKPYNDTLEHIRRENIVHADETSWPRGNLGKRLVVDLGLHYGGGVYGSCQS